MTKKIIIFSLVLLVATVATSLGVYTHWTKKSPAKSCASCHEIENSFTRWAMSSHRDVNCTACHGTALSNGFHSIEEKSRMFFRHFTREKDDPVKLTEAQNIKMIENCRKCHADEFNKWHSSGHSATYEAIFLNEEQNNLEQLNFDCLRCHGMFFEGNIRDLVEPLDTAGPWQLKLPHKKEDPTIPCMACHQIHQQGNLAFTPDHSNPESIFYTRPERRFQGGFYDRHEERFLHASILPDAKIYHNNKQLEWNSDPAQRMCIQCHAPNAMHASGSEDDRTPRGVHEGLSCRSCHQLHSNDARESCRQCHPAISNCNLDVEQMNTTYKDKNSPNNIHFVECGDCHK